MPFPHRENRLHLSLIFLLLCFFVAPAPVCAATVSYHEGVVGRLQQYKVRPGESLVELARRFDVGYNSITVANPGVDPFIPRAGTIITIPTAWIPPPVEHRPAIVVNLPEYRLYYFSKDVLGDIVTFPLGIGEEGRDTPAGSYTLTEKVVNPSWFVPASIRSRSSGLPRVVPPGPRNPLGSRALRLSRNGILIHGTNKPWGIGRRSSHGCLRLYPDDIVVLFELVSVGTRVVVMNQPVKIAREKDKVFVEVHTLNDHEPTIAQVMRMLRDRKLLGKIDFAKLLWTIAEKRGVPVEVTLTPLSPH